MDSDDRSKTFPKGPIQGSSTPKTSAETIPGLPPEDELREKLRRIKKDVVATFERMKRERKKN